MKKSFCGRFHILKHMEIVYNRDNQYKCFRQLKPQESGRRKAEAHQIQRRRLL